MIEIIRKADICRGVPDAWAHQYRDWRSADKSAITAKLRALRPEELTPERIAEIIGNSTWTGNCCDECGEDCEILIRIGEEPDYEARWVDICQSCLGDAYAGIIRATSGR